MGIQGLLPLLREIHEVKHVGNFKGKTLAVDAYVWLHRGAFTCAPELVKGHKTTKFVEYAMSRVHMLQHYGVRPYIVFDGGPLPAKKGTEVDRAKRREDHLAKAEALEVQGRVKEARDAYAKCIDITPEMALQFIKALKAKNIDYIVAPFEADAQLRYLEREGFVDGIITEDSDLLVFGCANVIYKLDTNGSCVHIDRNKFGHCVETSFSYWTDTEFRRMAILAGCDYLDSLPGIGLKTAHKLLRKHKTVEKLIRHVRLEGNISIPADYIEKFRLAELVFLHQRVYDPRTKALATLLPIPEDMPLREIESAYVGADMPAKIAEGIATGALHPETKQALADLWPAFQPGSGPSSSRFATTSSSSAARQSKPLTPTTKLNMAAGPLDGFFTRTPKAQSSSHIFKPIFSNRSGPARLSDIGRSQTYVSTRSVERPSSTTDSKFFARSRTMPSIAPSAEFRAVELFHTKDSATAATGGASDRPIELEDAEDDARHTLTSPPRQSQQAALAVIDCDELSSPEKCRADDNDAASRLASPGSTSARLDDGFDSEISTPGRKSTRKSDELPTQGREPHTALSSSPTAPTARSRARTLQRSDPSHSLEFPRTPDDEPSFSQVLISQQSTRPDDGNDEIQEEDSPRKRMRLVQESDEYEERMEQEQTTRKIREGLRQKYAFKVETPLARRGSTSFASRSGQTLTTKAKTPAVPMSDRRQSPIKPSFGHLNSFLSTTTGDRSRARAPLATVSVNRPRPLGPTSTVRSASHNDASFSKVQATPTIESEVLVRGSSSPCQLPSSDDAVVDDHDDAGVETGSTGKRKLQAFKFSGMLLSSSPSS